MAPHQIAQHQTQHWHSRNLSTQEVATSPCSPQQQENSMPLSSRGDQLHAHDRYHHFMRTQARLPSLEGCFQCGDADDDDQVSLNSQIKRVHEKDGSDSDDDDDSILSQIKLMSAVETATFVDDDDDTVVQENDVDSDDDSLSSIVSKAYSVVSSSSCSESSDHGDSAMGYKKRVIFVRERNEIHNIPSREDFSKAEIQKAWYQHEEMSAMVVARFKEDARAKKKNKEPEKAMDVDPHFPTDSTTFPSSLLPLLQGQHHEAIQRQSSCQPDEEQSEARIHALVDAVMDEQDCQWELEEEDWDKLAKASLTRSGMCAAEALMRAQLDALAAIPIYLEDAMETLREHSTRESAHRRKLEEIYPLSPMAVSPRARSTKKNRHRAARKNSVVSESRWSPASTKRTWTGQKGESSIQLQNALEIPLRMASNHGESSRQQNGLSMPLRMASSHSTEHETPRQQIGLSMPMRMASNHGSAETDILSVVSSDDDSINSESEFGEIDFEEELAPPAATVSVESRVRSKKKTKLARTRKMFTTKESSDGIYQKVKRKLQRSSKKKKNKRKKKEKSTKTEKKKKVKGTKKGEATDKDPSVPSGLSDEFAEMDTSEVKHKLVAL